jgi:hypothetical protein
MSEDRPADVLSSLPHSRAHRRSSKRSPRPDADSPSSDAETPAARVSGPAAAAAKAKAKAKAAKAKAKAKAATATATATATANGYHAGDPGEAPSGYQAPDQELPRGTPLVATTVQAAAELAEICLSLSARAIRAALARLPRP